MAEPNWKEFCSQVLNIAHEGDLDPEQVYNIGTETGCVKIVECTVPCVPDDNDMIQCGCAEYCDHGEVVDCHRLADSPNTRALDERVKELAEYVSRIQQSCYEQDKNNDDDDYHVGGARTSGEILSYIKELFPAELKELKESQDG